MPRLLRFCLLIVLLSTGCGIVPTATVSPPTGAPTPIVLRQDAEPTSEPTAEPEPPTAEPTAEPTSEPAPAEPTAEPEAATATPAPPSALEQQQSALLPEFHGDLAQADRWNRYTVQATLNPDARTLSGALELVYTNRDTQPLNQIYLRLFPNLREFAGALTITDLTVDGVAQPIIYQAGDYVLRVELAAPLEIGVSTTLTMNFTARTPRDAAARNYGAYNLAAGVFALASALPIVALVRDGVWEIAIPSSIGDFVNSETSIYDVTLTAPTSWRMVTTGSMIEQRSDGDLTTMRFVSGPQRDFAIAAVQLAVLSATVDGTTINSYHQPANAVGGQQALDAAVRSLRVFNARFGRYPLQELDIIQIDARRFLGVEYPGLIMMEGQLYAPSRQLELVIAHEVAHQWWFSLVGSDVQRGAWVDEGITSYSEIVYLEEIAPERVEAGLSTFRERYLSVRNAGRDGSLERTVAEMGRAYYGLAYGKAALFFQAMRNEIGEEAFDRFVKRYYAEQRYGYANGAAILANAEAACSCELDDLYNRWVLATGPVAIP
jgi:aminopeptidase N